MDDAAPLDDEELAIRAEAERIAGVFLEWLATAWLEDADQETRTALSDPIVSELNPRGTGTTPYRFTWVARWWSGNSST